jgi:hypothetical protein
MVQANLKIINELKIFLYDICKDESFRELVASKKQGFSRNRKLSLERVASLIINLPKRSLSIEIQEFFETLSLGLKGCTKGVFSLRRGKLSPLFFKVWNQWLVDNFYQYYGDNVKRWRGVHRAGSRRFNFVSSQQAGCESLFWHSEQPACIHPHGKIEASAGYIDNITVWGDIYSIKESEQLASRSIGKIIDSKNSKSTQKGHISIL